MSRRERGCGEVLDVHVDLVAGEHSTHFAGQTVLARRVVLVVWGTEYVGDVLADLACE